MTVQDLIETLETYSKDALVFVDITLESDNISHPARYAPAQVTTWSTATPDIVIITKQKGKVSVTGAQIEEGWRPKV